jgi:hypothetical protein
VRGAQVADAITARWVVRFHAVAEHVSEVMAARLRIPRERIDIVSRGWEPDDERALANSSRRRVERVGMLTEEN